MAVRGVRGAITVAENTKEEILQASRELLEEIIQRNGLAPDDIISVLFTATNDLDAAYPAVAAREMGWTGIPLLCAAEMHVAGSLRRCIRVLIQVETRLARDEVRHVYLREARVLRPDIQE